MSLEKLKAEFTAIYNQNSDALFRFCLTRVSQRELSLELSQEAFARLWARMAEGGKGREVPNPRAFLYLVTRRLIIDWYRKTKTSSLDHGLDEEGEENTFDPADDRALAEIEAGPEGRRVMALLSKLDEDHREVIHLRFVEELSPREIAEILGVSPNAVSIRITRGLAALRKLSGIERLELE
jgi:RNA polymerase sigma-70 factor, ECF subfamily